MDNLKYFFTLFKKKDKIYVSLIFFGAFVVSLVESLSLGSVAGYIVILSDSSSILDKLPSGSIKTNLQSLDQKNLLIYSTIGLIILFIIKNIFLLFFNFFSMKVEKNIYLNLSERLVISYLNQPYIFHTLNNPNNLKNSIISETARSVAFIFNFLHLIREFLVLFFLIISAFIINYKIALLILLTMGISSFIFLTTIKNYLIDLGIKSKIYAEDRLKHLYETFGIIKIIKLNDLTKLFVKKFYLIHSKKINTENKHKFVSLLPRAFLETLAIIIICLTVYYFIYKGVSFKEIFPSLSFLVILLVRSIPAFGIININTSVLQYHKESMKNILMQFKKYENLKETKINKNLINNKIQSIQLSNVNFSYSNSSPTILDDISIELNKGETIGFVGESGSGKTTLIDIILGLFDPKKGEIKINGKNNLSLVENFENAVGYVPQDIFLVDDTILFNITLDDKIRVTDDKINKIIEDVDLKDFIKQSPEGLNTIVGNKGIKISGGQKQRLGIARMLYQNPELIIMDESTNALDYETEKKIFNKILKLKQDKIIIFINHRLQMLKNCDKIFVLEKGKINKNKNINDDLS